jgi:hypothetical protein
MQPEEEANVLPIPKGDAVDVLISDIRAILVV